MLLIFFDRMIKWNVYSCYSMVCLVCGGITLFSESFHVYVYSSLGLTSLLRGHTTFPWFLLDAYKLCTTRVSRIIKVVYRSKGIRLLDLLKRFSSEWREFVTSEWRIDLRLELGRRFSVELVTCVVSEVGRVFTVERRSYFTSRYTLRIRPR
jgi:hypothetical protein